MLSTPSRSWSDFASEVASLPVAVAYSKARLLDDRFLLDAEGQLLYHAPFDFVNEHARVVLVGVTPGWTQMNAAYVAARSALERHLRGDDVLREANRVAAFSGSLRSNLVAMLDGIAIDEALGIASAVALFEEEGRDLLHSTSAIRNPVFASGRNYAGSHPAITASPMLRRYLSVLVDELQRTPTAIVVPLGRAVEHALQYLVDAGEITSERCLFGLPHPSGANAHRARQFADNRERLKAQLSAWFNV